MSGRVYRGLQRSMALLACLLSSASVLTGSPASPEVTFTTFRVLQLNLCNSGLASCYSGEAVNAAATAIRRDEPEVVTLNEICQDDVATLAEAFRRVHRSDTVAQGFVAAPDRRTNGPTRCRNGQPYGIGLLAYVPEPDRAFLTSSGTFPAQDTRDPEIRAWACVHVANHFLVCTTHLASTDQAVAMAQCRYLLDTAIPGIHARDGYEPTVVAGDLNLRIDGNPQVGRCVPAGQQRRDDSGVQHLVATRDFTIDASRTASMNGLTDHPSLLVTLTVRAEVVGRKSA